MKRTLLFIFLPFLLVCCSDNKTSEQYPVIDVVGSVENYQRVYCSELFSSIELIPLETRAECLLDVVPAKIRDGFIFMHGNNQLYVFDSFGKFLNKIGARGQGPGEYMYATKYFFNTDKDVIYIEDLSKILEYDFKGNYIQTIQVAKFEDITVTDYSYVGNGLFVGQLINLGKNKYKYCLFDSNGDIINCFPNYIFFNKEGGGIATFHYSLTPIRVDNKLYLKDFVNDTLYIVENLSLLPAYVFRFGDYSFPKENLGFNGSKIFPRNSFVLGTGSGIVGTPKFFFYSIHVPDLFSKPKTKPRYNPFVNEFRPDDANVYGIYNIAENTNLLLDTDEHNKKGIINDINGGLPFIPRYYAGDGIVIDVWNAEDMKGVLTEEYFVSQTIKDQQAHQKLKEILKNLKDDDNPVVVIAKLK